MLMSVALGVGICLILISIACSWRGSNLLRQNKPAKKMFVVAIVMFVLAIVCYLIPLGYLLYTGGTMA